jgi:hypothetical protein
MTALLLTLHPYAAVVGGIRVAWFTNPTAAEATAKDRARFFDHSQLLNRYKQVTWAVVDERSGVLVAGTRG